MTTIRKKAVFVLVEIFDVLEGWESSAIVLGTSGSFWVRTQPLLAAVWWVYVVHT